MNEVAPPQCSHEIFSVCNMCVLSHVNAHTTVAAQSPAFMQFGFMLLSPVEDADTHSWAETHIQVLTVQWTDKSSQSHNLYCSAMTRTQLTAFCRQCSKSYRVKLGILFPFSSQFSLSFVFTLVSFYLVGPLISLQSSFLPFSWLSLLSSLACLTL